MHSAPLSLTTLQQLQGAIADALVHRMRDEAAVLGERREVAVLAVQVALPQSPGEEARIDDAPWVDEALRIILAIVHRYAGAIDSFEFNNILALFGVPFAHEDDAERAALAALAIQQAIHPLDARLRHQHNLTLILKIGLHIGQLIQGQMGFGELDYTVIGDTTQRVRRLQDAADDGAILASASIYERTKASFAYQTSQLMQGAYAEAAYLLSRAAVPASAAPRAVAQGAMIGRTSEFASLLAVLDDMIREPCGRVVLISGDAGIGKSRLIAEFCDAVSRLPVRWCVVSCSALNRVTPLFLAAGLLRTLFGITADLPATSQRELFALGLSRLQLVAEDLLPYIEHVLSIRQATEARNDRLRVLDPNVEATQILSTAVAALRNAGDGSAHRLLVLVEALRELAEAYQRDGTLDLAVTALTEGLALLQGAHAPAYRAVQRTLIDRLAAVRFRQGDLEAAYHLATEETSAAALDENTDPVTLASLYNTLGGVFWQRGDLAEASQSVEQSLHLYERVSYSWGMATAYTNLGVLNYALGRWLQAVEQFQRSELLRKEIGYLPERAVNLKNLGVLQIEMGDHEQARQSLELSLAISRGIGDDYGIVVATLQLADLALLQRVADARIHLDHAAHLLPAADEDEQILFRWLIGLAAAAEGRCEEAITHVSEALELAMAAGVPELEIDCRRVLGALEGQRGALDAAERELQAALALSREHASAFREGLAHYELGWQYLRRARQQTPADPVERERARASYQQALACFAALGARYAQQRAQSALLLLE